MADKLLFARNPCDSWSNPNLLAQSVTRLIFELHLLYSDKLQTYRKNEIIRSFMLSPVVNPQVSFLLSQSLNHAIDDGVTLAAGCSNVNFREQG